MKSEEFATARLAKFQTLSMCLIDSAKVLHRGGTVSAFCSFRLITQFYAG